MREMADMALSWRSGYTREMLCNLIQHLHGSGDEYQAKVWDLVKEWATEASDVDKAFVREKIRVTVMSRRAMKRQAWGISAGPVLYSGSVQASRQEPVADAGPEGRIGIRVY